jgi:steroid 5-alpha reductase family enzyme
MFINSPTAPRPGFDEVEPRDVTVIIGVLVAIFGLVFETISDHIKFRFRNNPNNSGKWCDTGPWKVSRHPNYFGEICFWWGIFIISTSILEGWKWIAIISPLFITTILIGGSGMPLVERNADKKYGREPDYQSYKAATSPLIPFIPQLYRRMNKWLKLIFCCEFPCYAVKITDKEINEKDEVEVIVDEKKPISP